MNENSALSETVTRMRAEHTILFQKRRRLEQQFEQYTKEIKATDAAMARLHVELQRVNGLIAANSEMRNALQVGNLGHCGVWPRHGHCQYLACACAGRGAAWGRALWGCWLVVATGECHTPVLVGFYL